jgi:hypothetical protein
VWAVLATALLSLPSLFVPFESDDLSHRLLLEGRVPGYTGGWFGLYDFTPPSLPARALMDQGLLPWFTSPALSLRFPRPISSATLALDHVLFGRDALLAHVHSLVWLAVLVFAAARLYQRWFAPPAALLAALVFALSGVHAIPINWIAARHTLVAGVFGLLALWAWARFREDGFRAGAVLALPALVASLLSSESGLVAVLLLAGYELGTRGLRRGLRSAALPLGMGLAYIGLYAALGYGAKGSSFYVSPFDTPLAYIDALVWGVPALAVELLLGLPSIASSMGGRASQIAFAALGLGALSGAFFLLRRLGRVLSPGVRQTLAWLSLAGLLGLGALVGTMVSGRVLPLPLFAGAAIGGNALWAAWLLARGRARALVSEPASPSTGRKRWWAAFALVAIFQLVVPVLVRLAMPAEFKRQAVAQRQLAEAAEVGSCMAGGSLYLLNGADPTLTLYAGAALAFHTPEKAHFERLRVLSMAPQTQALTRTAPAVFELAVLGTPRQHNPFEQLFRAADLPLVAGQSVRLPELGIQVEEAQDGLFTRARFEFSGGFDPTRNCLLLWRDGHLQNVAWPKLGESLRLEHERGPMGL